MRRLIHLLMSPPCRFVRLALGEKRLSHNAAVATDPSSHLPVLIDLDETTTSGMWAIIDHLEGGYPEPPLLPEDPRQRSEALRLLDWTMSKFHDEVTGRIVFEKAPHSQTGSLLQRPPSMEVVRAGRKALQGHLANLEHLCEERGYMAGREVSLADLALAAHLSALDYFGEVPWEDNQGILEWFLRMKSRPSFRPLLSDRLPGQPPALHYAELDF